MTDWSQNAKKTLFLTMGRKYATTAVVFSLGIILTGLLYFTVRGQEKAHTQAEFERQANSYAASIQNGIDRNLEVLESVGGLFAASAVVERQDFRAFVEGPLSRHPEIQALSWNQRVKNSDRAPYEAATQNDGSPGFQITERNANGQMERAERRAEHISVTYIEPLEGNGAAVGFDVASNPTRLKALESSRETGEMVATARITLVQETEQQFGILILKPVYQNGTPHETVEQRRQNLTGFAVGVFRIGEMVEASVSTLPEEMVHIQLVDERSAAGERLLYLRHTSLGDGPTDEEQLEIRDELFFRAPLEMPGRQWTLLITPAPEFLGAQASWVSWGVLAGGLLITALLIAYLSMINRAAKTGRLAAKLTTSNEDLERDITERRRTEEALRESEERYRLLVELSPEAIFVHSDGEIVYANAATARLLGADHAEDLLGESSLDFVHEEFREMIKTRMQSVYAGAMETPLVEAKVIRLDQEVRDVESVAVPIRHEGKPAALILKRDITERKQLQEQLMQSQKMELVGQLAGGVAHDFNNFLTPIMSYAGLLMAALPPGDPARQHLQDIQNAAERGASVTRQLLTFSRRQIIQPETINLNDLVVTVDRMLRRLIGEDIELECRQAPDVSTVKVDPGQMEQVLVNMAVNARGAMPQGGKLTIETANITLDEASARQLTDLTPGRYVRLSVADTGAGMAEEVRSRVFEPFFTTKGVGEGTGLGLSICYGIVKQSEGEILVRSEPGKGATFEIYLPWVDEAVAEAVDSNEQDELPQGSEAVLVAEDEPSVRRLTADVLSQQGYTVLEAATGEEALQVARDYRGGEIDLLFTDVVMPQMSGKDLADRLGSRFPAMKVLFTSGYPGEITVRHGLSNTDLFFLPKPFTLEMLARKVREALDAPQHSQ